MACKVLVSVISEQVVGDIGDDWAYLLEAQAVNNGVTYQMRSLPVAEHRLKPGANPTRPLLAQGLKLDAGDCETAPRITIKVSATEVDWFDNDDDSNTIVIPIECPGHGYPPTTLIHDMTIKVREEPGLLGGRAELKLKLSLVASCE